MRARQRDRARTEPLHGERKVREAVVFRKCLAQQTHGACVDRVAMPAVLRTADAILQPARFAQCAHALAAGRVGVVMRHMREMLHGPCFYCFGQFAMTRLEERPGQRAVRIVGLHNQSPSNTGRDFAANARYARSKSRVVMQMACACASDSIASSMLMLHSWCSIFLVTPCANVGPAARSAASFDASSSSASGAHRRL